MSEQDVAGAKPPVWYWIVAVLAVLWNIAGCYSYIAQVTMSPEAIAALPPAQQELFLDKPAWATAAYAIAVWTGLAAAVLLLLRRRWARIAYVVSLAAVVVQFGWTFLGQNVIAVVGPAAALPLPVAILVLSVAQLWFTGFAAKRGLLK